MGPGWNLQAAQSYIVVEDSGGDLLFAHTHPAMALLLFLGTFPNPYKETAMQLKVHGANITVTDAISSHVQDRFQAALDQHARRVSDVTVRLEDVNGPKGGVDMRCHATVHLRRGEPIVVDDVEDNLYAAISVAADRVKHVVTRHLEKRRRH